MSALPRPTLVPPPNSERATTLALIVPVYNEEEAIPLFLDAVREMRLDLSAIYGVTAEVIFVDDGSKDRTRERIQTAIQQARAEGQAWIRLVGLSRNFGKEVALTAGLEASAADLAVPMDVDLQDPPDIVLQMVQRWMETGACIVQAVRADRSDDTVLKRFTSGHFYRVMRRISSVPIEPNAGDFQLLTRPAIEAMVRYPERSRFMKGIAASVGFRREKVFYKRPPRSAGRSKFNGWRLWNFALDGITAFSTLPLRVWTYIGAAIGATALLFALFIVFRTLAFGVVTPGYASLMVAVLLVGGLQLIGIGVVGEYVGRISLEVKNRPMYHVEVRDGFSEVNAHE